MRAWSQICLQLVLTCVTISCEALCAGGFTNVCAHIRILVQELSDRGCPYMHMTVVEGQGRVLLKFLTDLIYCDTFLLSGVICSIGACAPVDITKSSTISSLKLPLIQRLRHNHRL